MKKYVLLFLIAIATSFGYAQTVDLTVTFKFFNIVEGYDHNTKTEVFIDGESVGVSPEVLESKGSSFKVKVPTGQHDLRVVNYAEYEGNWEEHTIENQYSIDCIYETKHNFKKNEKLFLNFDIDSGTLASWKKAPKMPKKK